MENLSGSFSKRSYGGNGFGTASHKSVYDDVFGGPPKFGMPTLAPRLEDYSEIFGGFHSARGSSIPLLDLPVLDEAELCFDVRSSRFDYTDVFGGFNGLDFALSFDDFVRKSNGRDEASDDDDGDAWSPAEYESPSVDTDPSAFSDRSPSLINEDAHQPTSGMGQFDSSYSGANQGSNGKVSSFHVAQSHAIPGNAYMSEKNHIQQQKVEFQTSQSANDFKCNIGFDGGTSEEKKTIFLPGKFDFRRHERDCGPVEKHRGPVSNQNKPFVTVNDISLRTKPSHLPPPSRPPPLYAEKKGASAKLNLRPKDANGGSSEKVESSNASPPFYDVEIDGVSSTWQTVTVRDAMEKAQAKIRNAKDSLDTKEVAQTCSMLQPESFRKTREENVNKTVQSSSSYEDDRKIKKAEESSGTGPLAKESKPFKMDQEVSDLVGPETFTDFAGRFSKSRNGRESGFSYQISHKSAQAFAWRQETEYFEVVEAGIPFKGIEQHKDEIKFGQKGSDEFGNWVVNEAFEQQKEDKDFKAAKEAPKFDEKKNKVKVTTEICGNTISSETLSNPRSQVLFQKTAKGGLKSCESDMDKEKIKMAKQVEEIERNHKPRAVGEKTGSDLNNLYAKKTNQRTSNVILEIEDSDETLGEAVEQEESEKTEIILDEIWQKQDESHEKQKNKKKHNEAYESKEIESMPKEVSDLKDNEEKPTELKEYGKNLVKSFEKKENKKRQELNGPTMTNVEVDMEESSTVTSTPTNNSSLFEDFEHQEFSGRSRDAEVRRDCKGSGKVEKFDGTGSLSSHSHGVPLSGGLDNGFGKLETTQASLSCEDNEDLKTKLEESEHGIDVRVTNCLVEERHHSVNQDESLCENGTLDTMNVCWIIEDENDSCESDIDPQNSSMKLDEEVTERPFEPDRTKVKAYEQELRVKTTGGVQLSFTHGISKDDSSSHHPCKELSENEKVTGDGGIQLNSGKQCFQNVEEREKTLSETLAAENNEKEERWQKERELEKEHLRKIEAEREREREREKDRMAVDRAALETCDRLYAARERAERAAAEVRQRAMAEASSEARERSLAEKAAMEARLKAERAAVERATLEARQRAFEKAMVDRVLYEGRGRVERSVSDKFFSSSRTDEMRHSSSFSNVGTWNPLRYSYSSVHIENESESPQRCKARLERYRRTAERAAKALEEKNLRDLVAQREQAERNRLAETLDAEVKRWSSGKEGNLRALLSTLQYILGPESGWQPIPLTEVITSAAVKKAYRKATLCVHPDKLQQRRASIQQKYICEKVFDLLKEAWSIFNSEER